MQDEVNTKVVAIMIKGGKISAEVLKKALDKFVQEIEKAQKQMQQPKNLSRQAVHQASDEPERRHLQHRSDGRQHQVL